MSNTTIATKIDYSLPILKEDGMTVMVPAHCIARMFAKLSSIDDIFPGTAMARDIEIVRSHYINEAEKTNNIWNPNGRHK